MQILLCEERGTVIRHEAGAWHVLLGLQAVYKLVHQNCRLFTSWCTKTAIRLLYQNCDQATCG